MHGYHIFYTRCLNICFTIFIILFYKSKIIFINITYIHIYQSFFMLVSQLVCLFVCLFVLEFIFPLENFYSYGDVTIAVEGLQNLTCARHSWPLSSEGSLAYHTYCDTGHLRGPLHSHLLPSANIFNASMLFYTCTVYQVFLRAFIFRYVCENIKVVNNAFA